MKAVQILGREHALVRKLLRCLGALTMEARVTGRLDRRAARALLRLLEGFVDWTHQDKEELHLFPHMLARATAEEAEYLDRVFGEHAQERRRLMSMFLHLEGAAKGEAASVDRFVASSILYQRLQTKHVEAEDEVVLPLAGALLTAEDDERIVEGFRAIDARIGTIVEVGARVDALCERFGLKHRERRRRVPELIAT